MQLEEITFCVKTFNRYSTLWRCLWSLQNFAPQCPVIVCDDSTEPQEYPKNIQNRIQIIRPEPDVGVSVGRNLMVENVKTKYAFILDDDHAISKGTNFGAAVKSIPKDWETGIIAFPLFHHKKGYAGASRFTVKKTPSGKIVDIVATLENPVDIAVNNFVAPTGLLLENPWPPELKVGEHFVWFWDLFEKGQVKIYCMPRRHSWYHMIGDPAREHISYKRYRSRPTHEKVRAFSKRKIHSIKWIPLGKNKQIS